MGYKNYIESIMTFFNSISFSETESSYERLDGFWIFISDDPVYYMLQVSVTFGSDVDDVKGGFFFDGNDDPNIEIDIYLKENFFPESIKKMLLNCIAHEFRHSIQDFENDHDYSNYFEYFMTKSEIDAFSFGFVVEINIFGGKIEDAIDEYLENYREIVGEDNVIKIKKTWMQRAFEILSE
jgi:hypothetical protein